VSATTLSQTNINNLPLNSWHILHYKENNPNLPPTTLDLKPMLQIGSLMNIGSLGQYDIGKAARVVGGRLGLFLCSVEYARNRGVDCLYLFVIRLWQTRGIRL